MYSEGKSKLFLWVIIKGFTTKKAACAILFHYRKRAYPFGVSLCLLVKDPNLIHSVLLSKTRPGCNSRNVAQLARLAGRVHPLGWRDVLLPALDIALNGHSCTTGLCAGRFCLSCLPPSTSPLMMCNLAKLGKGGNVRLCCGRWKFQIPGHPGARAGGLVTGASRIGFLPVRDKIPGTILRFRRAEADIPLLKELTGGCGSLALSLFDGFK